MTLEQKLKLAKWMGHKDCLCGYDTIFLSTVPPTIFDPENDWNIIMQMEEKMIKELRASRIQTNYYHSGVTVDYYADTELLLTGEAPRRKYAILDAILKHVENKR